MKNRGVCFNCSIFLLQVCCGAVFHLQDLNSVTQCVCVCVHSYISSQTLPRMSGTNVSAKAVTALIAFKHTFILIIHLFSGIWDFALCTRLTSKKMAN